jgi:hypothetical protein
MYARLINLSLFVTLYCLPVLGQGFDPANQGLKIIYFLDPECPVTQSYMREIKNITTDYSRKGVSSEAVFPVYTVTDRAIRTFLGKYQITFPGSTDKAHSKTRRYHASVMPEVVLIDKNGMIIYQGAIDNWYVGLGKNRPKPTEFYLRNAIEATLNGNPVLVKKTEAVGCLIND